MQLITEKLLLIALFIFIIHPIETLAYAVRLSGARVRMIASVLSLFNIMVILSRMANMIVFVGFFFIEAKNLSFFQMKYLQPLLQLLQP